MSVIEVKNLTVTYLRKKEPALKNISFKVGEGEFIGLLGPLRAGKTTLLYTLVGIIPHTVPAKVQGTVNVDEKNPFEHTVAEMVASIGLVIDDPTVQVFNLTVEDDIAFGPLNLGMPEDEIKRNVEYALRATRLRGLEKRHPKELSGGQQQALSIASVLSMRPKILALDEPISMLDPIGKSIVLSAVKELNREYGIMCIIAESGSDLEEVLNMVTRVIVLNNGEVLVDGDPKLAVEDGLLEKIGVGLPQVSELFLKLKKKLPDLEVPVTLEEAVELLRGYINEGIVKIRPRKQSKTATSSRSKSGKEYIRISNLHFTYPNGVKALNGVDLTLREGELVGIIGQNGSGKTTLSFCIVGVYKPTNPDAEVVVDGVDVTKSSITEIIQKVNYIFQNPDAMLFSKDVYEEVSFGPRMLEYDEKDIKRLVEDVLKFLGLEEYKHTLIVNLPRYLRTMVGLASVLVLKPRILIVDEPTNGLDRRESIKLMKGLRELMKEGITFAIITHDMRLVSEFCDRVIVMNKGQVLLDGTPREVFSKHEVLEKVSLKPPQITQLAVALKNLGFAEDTLTVEEFLEQLEVVG